MLRYSDDKIIGKMETVPSSYMSVENITNPTLYNRSIDSVKKLIHMVNQSEQLYAAEEVEGGTVLRKSNGITVHKRHKRY